MVDIRPAPLLPSLVSHLVQHPLLPMLASMCVKCCTIMKVIAYPQAQAFVWCVIFANLNPAATSSPAASSSSDRGAQWRCNCPGMLRPKSCMELQQRLGQLQLTAVGARHTYFQSKLQTAQNAGCDLQPGSSCQALIPERSPLVWGKCMVGARANLKPT